MTPDTKARLASNLRDLPKTATLWVTTLVSMAASVYVSLPPAQQQQVLALLPLPDWALPFLAVLLPIAIARVWPQRSLAAPDAVAGGQVDIDPQVRTQRFDR